VEQREEKTVSEERGHYEFLIRPEDQGTLADFIDPVILTVQPCTCPLRRPILFYFNLD